MQFKGLCMLRSTNFLLTPPSASSSLGSQHSPSSLSLLSSRSHLLSFALPASSCCPCCAWLSYLADLVPGAAARNPAWPRPEQCALRGWPHFPSHSHPAGPGSTCSKPTNRRTAPTAPRPIDRSWPCSRRGRFGVAFVPRLYMYRTGGPLRTAFGRLWTHSPRPGRRGRPTRRRGATQRPSWERGERYGGRTWLRLCEEHARLDGTAGDGRTNTFNVSSTTCNSTHGWWSFMAATRLGSAPSRSYSSLPPVHSAIQSDGRAQMVCRW